MAQENHEIQISWKALWRIVLIVALVAGAFFAREAILALFLAIIISSALDNPVDFLNKKLKFPRILGTTIIFLLGILIVAFSIYIILPVVALEINTLARSLAGTTFGSILKDTASVIKLTTQNVSLVSLGQLFEKIFKGASPVFSTLGSLLSGVAFALSVLIISFYLTITRDGVGRFLRAIFPDESEDYILDIFYKSKRKIGRWFQAQMLLSLVIGVTVSVGLWILGVKYALVVGLIAALFEIMPVVGPVFSGAIGVLIALSDSLSLGLSTLAFFIVIQQLENHAFVPIFMKKVVDIHPVIALFSLLVGYQLFGIAGMIISVPVSVTVQEIIESHLDRKKKKRTVNK